jgi:hypothetical protein
MQEEEIDTVNNTEETVRQQNEDSGKEQDQGLMQFLSIVKETFWYHKKITLSFL